jgi:hypothetical protein
MGVPSAPSSQTNNIISSTIIPCGMYQHYKGDYYILLGVGEHTERDEQLAIYVSLDAYRPGPRIRCRPLKDFLGVVRQKGQRKKYVQRFTYVGHGAR